MLCMKADQVDPEALDSDLEQAMDLARRGGTISGILGKARDSLSRMQFAVRSARAEAIKAEKLRSEAERAAQGAATALEQAQEMMEAKEAELREGRQVAAAAVGELDDMLEKAQDQSRRTERELEKVERERDRAQKEVEKAKARARDAETQTSKTLADLKAAERQLKKTTALLETKRESASTAAIRAEAAETAKAEMQTVLVRALKDRDAALSRALTAEATAAAASRKVGTRERLRSVLSSVRSSLRTKSGRVEADRKRAAVPTTYVTLPAGTPLYLSYGLATLESYEELSAALHAAITLAVRRQGLSSLAQQMESRQLVIEYLPTRDQAPRVLSSGSCDMDALRKCAAIKVSLTEPGQAAPAAGGDGGSSGGGSGGGSSSAKKSSQYMLDEAEAAMWKQKLADAQ